MKILFVLHLPPPIHGAATVGLQIKNSKVVNNDFNCEYINLGTSVTIEEIGKRKLIKLFRYISILFKVSRQLLFNRPDLCYFSMTAKCVPFYKDATLALLVKLFRIKIVYHLHNKGVSVNQDKRFDNWLYQMVFKNSEMILLSPNLYRDVDKYVNRKHVHYCPNGIDDVAVEIPARDNHKVVELFFLSNLMESKGVFHLLDACKVLKDREFSFHCTFVGGIGDIDECRFSSKVQELDIVEYINYVGEKFGAEKNRIFSSVDIFVHPTLNDCFPLVLLEAMQYSLPVVSTLEGGIPEIVEDGITGFLVPKDDTGTLVEKLESLIQSSELRFQFGNAARKKFEREFTSEKFEHRLTEILHSIASK